MYNVKILSHFVLRDTKNKEIGCLNSNGAKCSKMDTVKFVENGL